MAKGVALLASLSLSSAFELTPKKYNVSVITMSSREFVSEMHKLMAMASQGPDGWCNHEWYSDTIREVGTLVVSDAAACAARCSKESRCKMFSIAPGQMCHRYEVPCSPERIIVDSRFVSYKKIVVDNEAAGDLSDYEPVRRKKQKTLDSYVSKIKKADDPHMGLIKTVQYFTCATGIGAACKHCRAQSARTGNDQCAMCNSGYRLHDTACKAFICITGPGRACGSCRAQSNRTADGQCIACNNGYGLTTCNNGYEICCEAFKCATGIGPACKHCLAQSSRSAANQCASCNSGYILNSASACQDSKSRAMIPMGMFALLAVGSVPAVVGASVLKRGRRSTRQLTSHATLEDGNAASPFLAS